MLAGFQPISGAQLGKPTQRGQFRIIGGRWRARKLNFVERPGLRPTPDRVRETLFNWLAPWIADARCLDLFAGSGALGLEALSRGAGCVTFVDNDRVVLARVREHLELLKATGGVTWHGDWRAFAGGANGPFDVIFADPPFASDYLPQLCTLLDDSDLLGPTTRLYVEYDRASPFLPPSPWVVDRDAHAGAVGYALLIRPHE